MFFTGVSKTQVYSSSVYYEMSQWLGHFNRGVEIDVKYIQTSTHAISLYQLTVTNENVSKVVAV